MAWIEIDTGGWLGVVFVADFKVRETMRQKRSHPEAELEREARTKDSELKETTSILRIHGATCSCTKRKVH